MTQADFGNPQSPFSGTQLINTIRSWRDALHTLHRGATRPSYAQGGTLWIQEVSSTQWRIMLFDGTNDIQIGVINPQADTFSPAISNGSIATAHIANGAVTPAKLSQSYLTLQGGTLSGDVAISKNNPSLTLSSSAPSSRAIDFSTSGNRRWRILVFNDAESGSNTGSTLYLQRFSDAGDLIGNVLRVDRDTGRVNFLGIAPRGPDADPIDSNDLARKAYVDTRAYGNGANITLSGYSVSYTDIPASATKIHIYVWSLTTSVGPSRIRIRAGGSQFATTGYGSIATSYTQQSVDTSGYDTDGMYIGVAPAIYTSMGGIIEMMRVPSNDVWLMRAEMVWSSGANAFRLSTVSTFAHGGIQRIEIRPDNPNTVFSSGSVRLQWWT